MAARSCGLRAALCLAVVLLLSSNAVATNILLYTRQAGEKHEAVLEAITALTVEGLKRGWTVVDSNDSSIFTPDNLRGYDSVVFLLTSGNVLEQTEQREALKAYVNEGGSFVGVHSAADTLADWDWYGELLGARYLNSPSDKDQQATVIVSDRYGMPAGRQDLF